MALIDLSRWEREAQLIFGLILYYLVVLKSPKPRKILFSLTSWFIFIINHKNFMMSYFVHISHTPVAMVEWWQWQRWLCHCLYTKNGFGPCILSGPVQKKNQMSIEILMRNKYFTIGEILWEVKWNYLLKLNYYGETTQFFFYYKKKSLSLLFLRSYVNIEVNPQKKKKNCKKFLEKWRSSTSEILCHNVMWVQPLIFVIWMKKKIVILLYSSLQAAHILIFSINLHLFRL